MVYIKIPKGISKGVDSRLCKLHKSLNELSQTSQNLYKKFTKVLLGVSFRHSKANHPFFILDKGTIYVTTLVYVDDVIILSNDNNQIAKIKTYLDGKFNIKHLGPLKYFLGIEVARTQNGMDLGQRKCTLDILVDSGLQGCRHSSFHMEQNICLHDENDTPLIDAGQY